MADNLVTGSTGATVAFAQLTFSGDSAYVAGQFVGILSGSEGAWTYTLLVGGAGAVTAGTPRVTLASDDPAVVSLAVLDDWDETNRCAVNLIAGQVGIAAGAGAVAATVPRMTLASDDPAVGHLATIAGDTTDIETAIEILDNAAIVDDAAFTPATTTVLMAGFEADETATDSVDEGDGGAARMTLDRKQIVTVQPHTAGGWSVFNATSSDGATALTSTAQAVKASAGQVGGWYIYNPNSSAQFVQFYNVASGSVTVGTTAPLFMLTIPATAGANLEIVNGVAFSTAIAIAATSTAGGNGAPTTALDVVILYK